MTAKVSHKYIRRESESTVENIMNAFLYKGQSLKWVGSMLEFCCSSELLLKNPEIRKKEILRIIKKYGKDHKVELIREMKKRGII